MVPYHFFVDFFLVLFIFFSFLIAVSCPKNKNRTLIKSRSGIQVFLLFFLIFYSCVTQGWPAEQVERGSHRLGDEAHQIASHGITRVNHLQFIWSSRSRLLRGVRLTNRNLFGLSVPDHCEGSV